MFDQLLESSHRDDSNKWSNIEFGEEIIQVALNPLIEVNVAPYLVLWPSLLFLNKPYGATILSKLFRCSTLL